MRCRCRDRMHFDGNHLGGDLLSVEQSMRAISFAAGLAMAAVACGGLYAEAQQKWVNPDIERTRICSPGAARAGRPSSWAWQRMKVAALDRAGIPRERASEYEYDHIVPRCLGGGNNPSNLQLQPWSVARAKDELERLICKRYCAGEMSLEDARGTFR